MDNKINNIENDDIKEDISELKIKEEDDIKSIINEIDNLVSSNDSNNSDLSNEEDNNEIEDGSDNIDHYDITEYNNNLLELYEEITNNMDKFNIENKDYKPNKNLREKIKNKIIRNNEEEKFKKANSNNYIKPKARKRKIYYMEDEEYDS